MRLEDLQDLELKSDNGSQFRAIMRVAGGHWDIFQITKIEAPGKAFEKLLPIAATTL